MANQKKTIEEDEKVILSYDDCLIRQKDKNLLLGPYWLNDVIIGFYMEYLSKNISDSVKGKKIVFASPELTQLLKMMETSDYSSILDSFIKKNETDIIFFPLNDCENRGEMGGSHWSLLIYSKMEKSCYHYDSWAGLNDKIANNFANKIITYFLESNNAKFIKVKCPQQENGYDCGIFVLCFAELISKQLSQQCDKIEKCDVTGVNDFVKSCRSKIIQIIDDYTKV